VKSYKLQTIGVIGVVIILGTWSLVTFSVIGSDSLINFVGQLIGATFLAYDAYTERHKRTKLMIIATHVLWLLIVLIALGDYFAW
jgi:hypothetical protein